MRLQRRQRDVEHRVVEPDDEQAERQDAERLPAARMDGGAECMVDSSQGRGTSWAKRPGSASKGVAALGTTSRRAWGIRSAARRTTSGPPRRLVGAEDELDGKRDRAQLVVAIKQVARADAGRRASTPGRARRIAPRSSPGDARRRGTSVDDLGVPVKRALAELFAPCPCGPRRPLGRRDAGQQLPEPGDAEQPHGRLRAQPGSATPGHAERGDGAHALRVRRAPSRAPTRRRRSVPTIGTRSRPSASSEASAARPPARAAAARRTSTAPLRRRRDGRARSRDGRGAGHERRPRSRRPRRRRARARSAGRRRSPGPRTVAGPRASRLRSATTP